MVQKGVDHSASLDLLSPGMEERGKKHDQSWIDVPHWQHDHFLPESSSQGQLDVVSLLEHNQLQY